MGGLFSRVRFSQVQRVHKQTPQISGPEKRKENVEQALISFSYSPTTKIVKIGFVEMLILNFQSQRLVLPPVA